MKSITELPLPEMEEGMEIMEMESTFLKSTFSEELCENMKGEDVH